MMASPTSNPPASAPGRWPVWLYPANVLTWLRFAAIPVTVLLVLHQRYGLALGLFIAAGVSDGLDGLLARWLNQRSDLGTYLDPLADKLLLSLLFVVLAVAGRLPWLLTILVFTRDACILVSALVIYLFTGFRDFRPTWWGKANTVAELGTVGAALVGGFASGAFVTELQWVGWVLVFVLSYVSGIDYAFTCARRFHAER